MPFPKALTNTLAALWILLFAAFVPAALVLVALSPLVFLNPAFPPAVLAEFAVVIVLGAILAPSAWYVPAALDRLDRGRRRSCRVREAD